MKISKFVFNPFGENTYIIWDEATRDAAIIDPGMLDDDERRAIDDFIARNGLNLKRMLITHVHIDHTFGADYIKRKYGLPLEAGQKDAFLGLSRSEQARMFHLPLQLEPLSVDKPLAEGDVIELGPDTKLRVLEVPGHSPGSLAFYSPEAGVVFTGDALFPSSVGRTDIPGGNHPELIEAIKAKLMPLPDETVVLAGHADETTIGRERKHNPYI